MVALDMIYDSIYENTLYFYARICKNSRKFRPKQCNAMLINHSSPPASPKKPPADTQNHHPTALPPNVKCELLFLRRLLGLLSRQTTQLLCRGTQRPRISALDHSLSIDSNLLAVLEEQQRWHGGDAVDLR